MHYWDFSPFRWYRPVWDYGNFASTIGLNIVMTGQGLYTHHNGMWFDGGRSLTANAAAWRVNSFTVDAWIKLYSSIPGTIIESTNGNPVSYSLSLLSGPARIRFTVNGLSVTTAFTFGGTYNYNVWMIAQASCARISDTESKL